MMRLTGRLADGLLVTSPVHPPQRLLEINALINAGAAEAGRSLEAIWRGHNTLGTIASGTFMSPAAVPLGSQPH